MPRIRFTENFDYHVPGRPVTVAYKAGWSGMVTTPCANLAIAASKAKALRRQTEAPNEGTSDSGPA